MKDFSRLLGLAALALALFSRPSHAQVIGSYDNFDCFNDTGETAEGFEIDIEDVQPSGSEQALAGARAFPKPATPPNRGLILK